MQPNTAELETNPSSEAPIPAPEAPAADPAPEAAAAAPDAPGAPVIDPTTGKEAAPAPYQANLKFKVMDKEHEFDPLLKDVIKDAETEKKFRELYEKAYGLDIVKPKFQETREQFKNLKNLHEGLIDDLGSLREMYSRGDLDSFFDRLKIPQEKILQWVVDKINYNELPPEQRQAMDAKRAMERQSFDEKKGFQSQQAQYEEKLAQARGQILDFALDRADVKSFSQQFEGKTQKSFRQTVIDYAEAVHFTRKDAQGRPVDLSPDQAIQELMQHYGVFVGSSAQPAAPALAPAPTGAAKEPPVIPNVSGRTTSPTVSKVRSIEDLVKIREQKFAK